MKKKLEKRKEELAKAFRIAIQKNKEAQEQAQIYHMKAVELKAAHDEIEFLLK